MSRKNVKRPRHNSRKKRKLRVKREAEEEATREIPGWEIEELNVAGAAIANFFTKGDD